MAKKKTDDEGVDEGPTAGLEHPPVERPYSEARDPEAFGPDAHHGYTDDTPGDVVDLGDVTPDNGDSDTPLGGE